MNTEQTIEAIKVMQAFVDGKEVQSMYDGKWSTVHVPRWSWDDTKYRIKPTPVFRPWTADEVPYGAWIRTKDALYCGQRVMIYETYDESIRLTWLVTSEYSADGGVNWKPCGVMEESK